SGGEGSFKNRLLFPAAFRRNLACRLAESSYVALAESTFVGTLVGVVVVADPAPTAAAILEACSEAVAVAFPIALAFAVAGGLGAAGSLHVALLGRRRGKGPLVAEADHESDRDGAHPEQTDGQPRHKHVHDTFSCGERLVAIRWTRVSPTTSPAA